MKTTQTAKTRATSNMSTAEAFTIFALIFFWPLGLLLVLLLCHRFLKKKEFWICLFIWAPLTTGAYCGIRNIFSNIAEQNRIKQEIIATERGRDYFINFDEEDVKQGDGDTPSVGIDCHLKAVDTKQDALKEDASPLEVYNHTAHNLTCSEVRLKGTFSTYETVDFHAEVSGGNLNKVDLDGQNFTVSTIKPAFYKSDWERDELPESPVLTSTIILYLTNNRLDSEKMTTYKLRINYRLSNADYKLLKSNQTAYQTYKAAEAERIAKEEQARKDEEARKQKEKEEEEKRIAKEEAEKKAKEEVAKQAATAQQATANKQPTTQSNNTAKPTTTTTQTTSSNTSKPSTSSNSSTTTQKPAENNNNLPLKAICKDGTVSYQDNASLPNYRGMCSGHGGIKTKLGRVP